MVKPYRPGVEAREAILRAMLRAERAGRPLSTVRGIAAAVGASPSVTGEHLATLRADGLVVTTYGRTGGHRLTPAGRIRAHPLTMPDE